MTREQPESQATRTPIVLDGRTLEGGGQLVRIAIVLSSLTGKPITIDHIRGNRSGKKGLKNSHLAAIKSLVEMSKSTVKGAQVNSSSLTLYPPFVHGSPNFGAQEDGAFIESEINIRLPTAGSVFLVFQALYPFLLHVGSVSAAEQPPIRMSITGGTNVSFSPSYDYVAQVLIPNFSLFGLPRLSLELVERGWSTGPPNLGKVTFLLDSLPRERTGNAGGGDAKYHFPPIDLNQYRRGAVSRIDITILAPDDPLLEGSGGGHSGVRKGKTQYRNQRSAKHQPSHFGFADEDGQWGSSETIRGFIEREVQRQLSKQLRKLPSSIFVPELSPESKALPHLDVDGPAVPINIHTTEATHHWAHLYVLIVAHTSTGLKIGHDALFGSQKGGERPRNRGQNGVAVIARDLVEDCVDGFVQELYNSRLQKHVPGPVGHQPCVDQYMRDQLVVFEALGRASGYQPKQDIGIEDKRYWSLHTQTAQWVCQQLLEDGLL